MSLVKHAVGIFCEWLTFTQSSEPIYILAFKGGSIYFLEPMWILKWNVSAGGSKQMAKYVFFFLPTEIHSEVDN